ncbi:MAG TPA: hypothetical protein VFZ89_13275 [Solirubrobacteraceae bacterium]
MLRAAALAVLTALALPALAEAKGASTPSSAVRAHYRHIYLGKFDAAWALLTPAAKRQLGPYRTWKAGYAETGQVTVYSLRRAGSVMRFNLAACRGDGDREVTIHERFRVTWPVRKIAGRWYLDRGVKVNRTSREEVERCSLPLP